VKAVIDICEEEGRCTCRQTTAGVGYVCAGTFTIPPLHPPDGALESSAEATEDEDEPSPTGVRPPKPNQPMFVDKWINQASPTQPEPARLDAWTRGMARDWDVGGAKPRYKYAQTVKGAHVYPAKSRRVCRPLHSCLHTFACHYRCVELPLSNETLAEYTITTYLAVSSKSGSRIVLVYWTAKDKLKLTPRTPRTACEWRWLVKRWVAGPPRVCLEGR